MLLPAFFKWWYGSGWTDTIRQSRSYLGSVAKNFSMIILLRTLFAPWKQMDAYAGTNLSLGDQFRHMLDKFVSRFVGFTVRSLTLFAACVSFVALLIVRAAWIILWPILPLLVPAALLYSVGVF